MHTHNNKEKKVRVTPTVSRVLADGQLVELLYSPDEQQTRLAVGKGDEIAVVESVTIAEVEKLVPVAAANNLIQHGVVLLPERAEPYADTATLLADIEQYIDRYLDLSPSFRHVASAYVLFTWVSDAFNEVPYLRLRGDFGTGKTRALTILGSLCRKAFFASGASTVSPIFYTLDGFKGTLILDEADFRFSDEQAEIVKILNNGNVRGFPVLRQSMTPNREFNPRAFDVFGPKIVAMRHAFDDPALESRFLTEDMGQRPLRSDIPINLPDTYKDEARSLRNQLLTYRFRTLGTLAGGDETDTAQYSARTQQILRPLLAVISDDAAKAQVMRFAESAEAELKTERASLPDGLLLEVVVELFAKARSGVTVSAITALLIERYGGDFDRRLTPRYVGHLLRKRLHLKTSKAHGVYVVPMMEKERVDHLADRFGIGVEDSLA